MGEETQDVQAGNGNANGERPNRRRSGQVKRNIAQTGYVSCGPRGTAGFRTLSLGDAVLLARALDRAAEEGLAHSRPRNGNPLVVRIWDDPKGGIAVFVDDRIKVKGA